MSSLYNLEPLPTAKCILHTSSGDLELELWAAQAPLASRSFLQHCLDGYYDGTIFHRLVPGFILQGGDPTGTGSGGESGLEGGRPFADEVHTRLKFNRRGLLGMANGGSADDNSSQFFLTLGKAEELNGKHTMFGRIQASDTIYNLVKMGEAELVEGEGSDRPLYPTKITGATVLVNPFEDMVKRARIAPAEKLQKGPPRKKIKKTKAKQLLSFGGDGDEEDGTSPPIRRGLANPKLVDSGRVSEKSSGTTKAAVRRQSPPPQRKSSPPPSAPVEAPKRSARSPSTSSSSSPSPTPEPEQSKHERLMSKANAEIAQLKQSLRRNVVEPPKEEPHKKTALEAMIPETATRGRKRRAPGGEVTQEEQRALEEFKRFQLRLESNSSKKLDERKPNKSRHENGDAPKAASNEVVVNGQKPEDDGDEEEAALCDLHFVPNCQSCKRWDEDDGADQSDGDDGDDGLKGLMSHRLTFEKDRLGKDLEWKRQNEQILEVFDTRERAREFRDEDRRRRGGGGGGGGGQQGGGGRDKTKASGDGTRGGRR